MPLGFKSFGPIIFSDRVLFLLASLLLFTDLDGMESKLKAGQEFIFLWGVYFPFSPKDNTGLRCARVFPIFLYCLICD